MPRRSMSVGLVTTVLLLSSWVSTGETRESPPPERFTSKVASVWFDTLYDLVKTEQLTPPVASRLYGVVAVALYEAIVPGSVQQRSLVGQLNALVAVPQPLPHRSYHWLTVANAALASTVRGLFPTASSGSVDTINGLEDHFASTFQARLPASVYTRSVTQGHAVADAVLAWASTDGSATFADCSYTPPVGPGL
jgi:hypothetical protein